MGLRAPKDAQGQSIDPNAMYQCIESWASQDDRCARGNRLLGGNELVQKHPELFVSDSTPDDVIFSLRAQLWEPAGGVQA